MYAIRVNGEANLRTNEALREYARLEYRREDVHWLVSTVSREAKARRAPRILARLGRKSRPSHRPVACKGSPHLPAGPDRTPG